MTRKAAATLRETRTLARAELWDGAASRAYYAVYQALVAEFEARGLHAADFRRADPRYPDKWPHWLVVANCRAAGLSRAEAGPHRHQTATNPRHCRPPRLTAAAAPTAGRPAR